MFKEKINFIKKILILGLLVFCSDRIIGSLLQHYYFKQKSGQLYETTYAMEKTNQELLVFGSSRANHHYDVNYIAKKFHISAYNVGRDGQYIIYDYAVLLSILKRYKPKIILLDLFDIDLDSTPMSDHLSALGPYYENHKEIAFYTGIKSPYEKIKFMSKIYPYNSMLLSIINGTKKNTDSLNGYLPLKGIISKNDNVKNTSNIRPSKPIDKIKLQYLIKFICLCKSNKINLILIQSPVYTKSTSDEPYEFTVDSCARIYKVPFWNFKKVKSGISSNNRFFHDGIHLNSDGAEIFTKQIVNNLSNTN